jgi:hypothetical protein
MLGQQACKEGAARRSRPKAKSVCRTGVRSDPPSGKRPKRKSEDTPERAQKKALKRKKKKALWSRKHRKAHKVELRDYQRAWRARKREDPKFVEKERKKNRICSRKKRYATYGMTIEDYNIMKAQQGGLCLICKGKRRRKRKSNPKRKNKDRRRHNGKRLASITATS